MPVFSIQPLQYRGKWLAVQRKESRKNEKIKEGPMLTPSINSMFWYNGFVSSNRS